MQRGSHPQPERGAGGAGDSGQLQEDLLARSGGLGVSLMGGQRGVKGVRGGSCSSQGMGHWGGVSIPQHIEEPQDDLSSKSLLVKLNSLKMSKEVNY